MTIAQALEAEQPMLQPLPVPFDGFFQSEHVASSTCLVSFDRNRYSVMAKVANQAVQVPNEAKVPEPCNTTTMNPVDSLWLRIVLIKCRCRCRQSDHPSQSLAHRVP